MGSQDVSAVCSFVTDQFPYVHVFIHLAFPHSPRDKQPLVQGLCSVQSMFHNLFELHHKCECTKVLNTSRPFIALPKYLLHLITASAPVLD